METAGGKKAAQAELNERERHVGTLKIRPLLPPERERYATDWTAVQAKFVDEPGQATAEADHLIMEVMQLRDYPVSDFEQRAADVSIQYPALVANYRAARAIAVLNEQHHAGTEDLRQAMIHYRSLFDELLKPEGSSSSRLSDSTSEEKSLRRLPQVAENNTPLAQGAPGECLLYDECMTRVYLADAVPDERSALRLLLLDLKMDVVGEAADWATTLAAGANPPHRHLVGGLGSAARSLRGSTRGTPQGMPGRAGHSPHQPPGCPPPGCALRRRRRVHQQERDA